MNTWISVAEKLGDKYNVFVPPLSNALCFFTGMSLSWPSPVLAKLNGFDDNPLGDPITADQGDLLGSVFSIGGAIGPIAMIFSLELIERKLTMSMLAMLLSISHFILAFSTNIYLYYFCRVLAGINVGGSFSIVAVYIGEISSVKWRGTYISLGTSYILTGSIASYTLGPYIPLVYFNVVIAVPTLLYMIVFPLTCPESLYYTMQKHGSEKQRKYCKHLEKVISWKNFIIYRLPLKIQSVVHLLTFLGVNLVEKLS